MKGLMSSPEQIKRALHKLQFLVASLEILPTDRENREFLELSKLTAQGMIRDCSYIAAVLENIEGTGTGKVKLSHPNEIAIIREDNGV